MNLIRLFKLLVLSHLQQEKLSVLFAVFSIILGVSVYVTIRLTTTNILDSFNASTNYISEKNTVSITSNEPISETIIPQLLSVPSVDAIIPINTRYVPAYADTKNIGYIQVIGLDILALNQIISTKSVNKVHDVANYLGFLQDQPAQVLVSKKLAEKFQTAPLNLLIKGEYKKVAPQGVVENTDIWGDYVLIIDIKNYQNLFNEYNTIQQLHLTFNTPVVKKALLEVAAKLPASLTLSQGNDNFHYAEDITSTYRFNLNFLNCLALLVTSIIIYNAISYYILERRRDFGIMLMLGAQPDRLFLFAMLNSILLAVFCSFGGLVVGYLITWINIKYIVQTFSALFLPMSITEVLFPPSLIIEVMVIVVTIALLVSILPCLEVYKIPARQTTVYQTYEKQFQTKIPKFTLLGATLLLLSLIGLIPTALKWHPDIVYFALCGILLGSSFFLPILLRYFLAFLRKIILNVWLEATMAVDHIKSTMRKNIVAIAAMSIAIALYLTSMIIIDSTRYTCVNWINQILSADVYVNNKFSTLTFRGSFIPNEMVDFIVKNPATQAANLLVHKDIILNNKSVRMVGMTFSTLGTYYKIPFVQPMNEAELTSTFSDPRNVAISEHFAHEFNYQIGDAITLTGNHGLYQARIANIFYNYANYQNILLIPNSVFSELYDDPRIESALIYLKDPGSYQEFLNSLNAAFPDENLPIQNQIEVKNIGTNMMEQTFKISKAIILAIFVLTALTLFNILEQLILSRRHEFTIFWSLGATDYTLIKMCLWESFIIYIAAVLGGIIPTVMGLVLIFKYLTKMLFGVGIMLSISFASIFSFFLLLALLVILDGTLPALKMKKFINAKGLRYE
jgi:putative ABC transport system permease protein